VYEPETDSDKFQNELCFLLMACRRATRRQALLSQLAANVAAAALLYAHVVLAAWLLEKEMLLHVLGFVVGVAGFGIAGLVLAAGATAVDHKVFRPDSRQEETLHFLEQRAAALVQCCGAFYAAFALVLCLLLVPTAAARLGLVGQVLYALLLIPMTALAAAGVLALVAAIAVVPAEAALRTQEAGGAFRSVWKCISSRAAGLAWTVGVAFVVSLAAAAPLVALVLMAWWCLQALAGPVAGVTPRPAALVLMGFSQVMLLGALAAPPMACFNAIIALRYRGLIEEIEKLDRSDGDVA